MSQEQIKIGDQVLLSPPATSLGAGQFLGHRGTVKQMGVRANGSHNQMYCVRVESGQRAGERWWFRHSELDVLE